MTGTPIRVLFIEDDPEYSRLIMEILSLSSQSSLEFALAQNLAEALALLENPAQFDLILADLSLPDSFGLDTLKRVREKNQNLPVVVLTGMDGDSLAMDALHQGAQDFLEKTDARASTLARVIRYAIERKHAEDELKTHQSQMESMIEERTSELTTANKKLSQEIEERKRVAEALRQSEAHYRLLAENISDVIWTADLNMHFRYISPSVTNLLGYTVPELNGLRRKDILTIDSLQRGIEAIREAVRQDETDPESHAKPWSLEMEIKRKDGAIIWTDTTFSLLRGEDGAPSGVLATTRDITESRQSRLRSQRSLDKTRVINSLLNLALEELPLDAFLDKALNLLLEVSWLTLESKGAIFLIEDEPEVLVLKTQGGLPECLQKSCARIPYGRCLCGRAAQEGKVLFVNEIDERHTVTYQDIKPHGHYCIPLIFGGQVVGMITLYVRAGHQPKEEEEEFLSAYANTLAMSISRRKIEDALRASEARLNNFFDLVPDPLVIYDMEGRVIFLNQAFEKTFGWSRREVAGSKIDFVPSESWPETIQKVELFKQGKSIEDFETKRLTKDGRMLTVVINTSPVMEMGKQTGNIVVFNDITKTRETQKALKDSEIRYRTLVEAMTEGLIMGDANGTLEYVNNRFCEMLGYSREELQGKSIYELTDKSYEEILLKHRERRAAGHTDSYELAWIKKDRSLLYSMMSSKPRYNSWGHHIGFQALITDITQRKKLEGQLLQAQKLEAIGQLAAGIAHEINTPTQYVTDNTRFYQEAIMDLIHLFSRYNQLRHQCEQEGLFGELVAEIQALDQEIDLDYLLEELPVSIEQTLEGLAQIAKIVRSMKEFAHPGPSIKTPIDLNAAIANTITVAHNEWKYVAEVATDFDPDLPLVECVAGEINQVVLNLMVNAAHAIGDQAQKEQTNQKGSIRISTKSAGDGVEIRVADDGPGIPENIRSRVFDPFFTTKEPGKGTGQGLSIAHSVIVDKHKGTLSFESQEGKGTTFIITLPVREKAGAMVEEEG